MIFPTIPQLKSRLSNVIHSKEQQGYHTQNASDRLAALPDSYDAVHDFARELAELPLRADWTYEEPDDLEGIRRACGEGWEFAPIPVPFSEAAARISEAFRASVCGCVLGKPLEVSPDMERLRVAFEKVGEWPIRDYVSEGALEALGNRHPSWQTTVRGNIRFVEPDDDINYTVLGMLVLERFGPQFSTDNVRQMWLEHNANNMTWGPERTQLLNTMLAHTFAEWDRPATDTWAAIFNPGDELCGAQIRADAYGYAAPGNPALAARMAFRDASFTHRKTGVYATMWTAAAIAAAFIAREPLEIFEIANRFVPPRSRFGEAVREGLEIVRASRSFLDGYAAIHLRFGEFGHCRVLQESATLINTLRWAPSVDEGFCLQVMQGNDTDSYGATSGSILGAFFGPGHFDHRWLAPFNDDIRTGLSFFFERSLERLATRMGELPHKMAHFQSEAPHEAGERLNLSGE